MGEVHNLQKDLNQRRLRNKFQMRTEIVKVKWLDAQSGFSSPLTIEELEREDPLESISIGYLLKEDEEKIILGFMMFGDEGMFKHWQLIPKGMIKKITKLREDSS